MSKLEEMKEKMNIKLRDMYAAYEALDEATAAYKQTNEQQQTEINKLETAIEELAADKAGTNVDKVKAAISKEKDLQEQLVAVTAVRDTLLANHKQQIADAVLALFTAHKAAKSVYFTLERIYMNHVSKANLKELQAEVDDTTGQLNDGLNNCLAVLYGYGIARRGDNTWHGHHLGQTPEYTNLSRVFK